MSVFVSFLSFDFFFAFFLAFAFALGVVSFPVLLKARLGVFALVGTIVIGNKVGYPSAFLVNATYSSRFGFVSKPGFFEDIVPFLVLTAAHAHIFAIASGAQRVDFTAWAHPVGGATVSKNVARRAQVWIFGHLFPKVVRGLSLVFGLVWFGGVRPPSRILGGCCRHCLFRELHCHLVLGGCCHLFLWGELRCQ